MRICFVCLGNICRSPTAEGVMRGMLEESDDVVLDSAGTGAWHVGELADPRSRAAAKRRGLELVHRARQVTTNDLDAFDLFVAMDAANLAALQRLARDRAAGAPPELRLLRSFDATAPVGAEVPDPYSGGASGFEEVLDQCERACRGLLAHVRARP